MAGKRAPRRTQSPGDASPAPRDDFARSQLAAIEEALTTIAALGAPDLAGPTVDIYALTLAQALQDIAQANSALDRDGPTQLAEIAAALSDALTQPNAHERVWAFLSAALTTLAALDTADPAYSSLIREGQALSLSLNTTPSADSIASLFSMTNEERALFGLDDPALEPEAEVDNSLVAQDPLDLFIAETRERLALLTRDLAALRVNPLDPDLQEEARRAYHTIKGGAALLGLPGLERLAKALQFLIDERRERTRFDRPVVELLDRGRQIIAAWLDSFDPTWIGDAARTVDGQDELEQQIADAKTRSGARGGTGGLSSRPTMLAGISHNLYSAYVTRLPQDLRTLHSALMILRQIPGDPTATSEARRALHGLKSRSSMVQILPLVKVAGEAEELLEAIAHETDFARTTALIDLLIQAEGIFYETQRLLHEETFDLHYPALSDLAVAMCRSMHSILEHWWQTGDGAAHDAPARESDTRAPASSGDTDLTESPRAGQIAALPVALDGRPAKMPDLRVAARVGPDDRPLASSSTTAPATPDRSAVGADPAMPESRGDAPDTSSEELAHIHMPPATVAAVPHAAAPPVPEATSSHDIPRGKQPKAPRRPKRQRSGPAPAKPGVVPFDWASPIDGHPIAPIAAPIDPWLPPIGRGQPPASPARAGLGDAEISVSALETPLDRLAALEALGSAGQSLLIRSGELAAQERKNIERLDAMVVRLLLEREELRRRNSLLRQRLAPRQGLAAWDELEIETFDSIDQTMVQLQEVVADGRSLSAELRATLERALTTTRRQITHTSSARGDLLALRMVSLQAQYERLDQVVMATASRIGRQVRFVMDADITLDREVAAALEVPLQHMVRNSVYHGIEDPDERRFAGKDPLATVWIRAQDDPTGVRIEVRDDGRGIDLDRLVAVAVGKGLLDPAHAATLGREERLRLIFASGLSTAEQPSDLAGRGIGMDAVLAAVRTVRGDLDVQSEPGRGAAIILRVPRSLAHALVVIVRQNDHEFALPFDQVLDSHDVRQTDLVAVSDGRAFAKPGERGPGTCIPIHEAGLLESAPQEESSATLILLEVRTAQGPVGVLVSEVVDVEMALVEPVPHLLRGVESLLGFLPTAAGRARPLVDAARIIVTTRGRAAPPAAPARLTPIVLVVDDSPSVRRYLSNLFTGVGYQVREATGGVEALQDIARRGLPDLVTLDVEMPGMDGMELLSTLRQDHGIDVPVFMITSRSQDRHRDAARVFGVTRYFNKPFNADEVLGAAALAIEAGRRPDEVA